MQRKLLFGSLALNAVLIIAIGAGVALLGKWASQYSRIPAERWRTQFDFLNERKGGIVFLGDSITEGAHWSEIFGDCAVLNRGIGGDTTQDVLDRIEQVHALEPSKLFLMIGVNDLNQGLSVESVLANYRRLFDALSERLPHTRVYVQSVLPVNEDRRWGADNTGIAALNTFLVTETERRGYAYVDLATAFRDNRGMLRKDLSNDGIHLLGPGYLLWRDLIRARVIE